MHIKNDGTRYEGEYFKGMPHGKGIYFLENGDRYEGEFRRGSPVGKGVYVTEEGERIESGFEEAISGVAIDEENDTSNI